MELLQQLSIIVHLLIITLSLLVELYRYKTSRKIFDSLFVINAFFGLYLGLIPVLFQFFYPYFFTSFYYIPAHIGIVDFTKDNPLKTAVIILICYLSYLTLYFSFARMKPSIAVTSSNSISNLIRMFVWCLGIISVVSLFIYIHSFGGVLEAIVSANLIRRHDGATSSFTFLRYIYPLVQPAAILAWAVWFHSRRKLDFLIFLFLFCTAILFLIINAGRANIVVFFGVYFVSYLSFKNRFSILTLTPFIILGLCLALFGNEIFTVLSGGEGSFADSNLRISLKLIQELSHVYVNLLKVNDFVFNGDGAYYFRDIPISLIELLPGGIEKDIWDNAINTTKTHTINFDPPLGTGIIVDLISYGYYQLGLPGAFITCGCLGLICSKTDNFFRARSSIFYISTLAWTAFFYMGLMTSFELKSIILGRAAYWLPLLYIIYVTPKAYERFIKNA